MPLNVPVYGATTPGAQVVSPTAITPDQGYAIAKAEAESILSRNKLSWGAYAQGEGNPDKIVGGRQGNLNLRKPYMAYLGWSVQNCKIYDPSGTLSDLASVPETTIVMGQNQVPQTIPLRPVISGMLERYAAAAIARDDNVCKYCYELLGSGEAGVNHYLTRHPEICAKMLGFPSPELAMPMPEPKQTVPFVPTSADKPIETEMENVEGYVQTPTVEAAPVVSRLENVHAKGNRLRDSLPRQCLTCGRIFKGEGGYNRHYTVAHKGKEKPTGKE